MWFTASLPLRHEGPHSFIDLIVPQRGQILTDFVARTSQATGLRAPENPSHKTACLDRRASLSPPADRWSSGRWHRTRNAAYLQGYRGFESHPVRQLKRPPCGAFLIGAHG